MITKQHAESSTLLAPYARQDWKHSDRIKRESRHIYNKLHSISHDSAFVHQIHSLFSSLLLIANLRCGAWYTDPTITSAVSYFKSTDGHTHQWSFSLKRSNLHLVPAIAHAGGAIVVDSTRRGKSMPDALSKTIPIWCAVLNKASNRKFGCPPENKEGFLLHTPQWLIPPTEHDQILAKIDSFVTSLLDSDLEVPQLKKPLKPIFITPQTDLDTISESKQAVFTPIILVSTSKFILDSAQLNAHDIENSHRSKDKFIYVQGAGDDHENWARGLTPEAFWKHRTQLLACDKENLEALVDTIVAEEASSVQPGGYWFTPLSVSRLTDCPPVATIASEGGSDVQIGATRVSIGTRTAHHVFSAQEKNQYGLIIHFTGSPMSAVSDEQTSQLAGSLSSLRLSPDIEPRARILQLQMSPNKKGILAVRTAYSPAIDLAHRTLVSAPSLSTDRAQVLICCQDGKNLSGSLAVAILASCFTDQRQLITDDTARSQHTAEISKDTTKRRLQWLVSANPRAAPSRAFLLRVNELLISPRRRPTRSNA